MASGRSRLGAVTATPTPRATSTHTPSVPTLTPTRTPSPTRVPTRNIPYVTVTIKANVRSGPGTHFEIVGLLHQGDRVRPMAQTGDGQWLQLEARRWLFAALVNSVPPNLPLADNFPIPPTPSIDGPHAGKDANLRAGPGTTFAVIGFVHTGDRVVPIGRSPDQRWLKLENSAWIFAELVNNIPSLPIVDVSSSTPVSVADEEPAAVADNIAYASHTANREVYRTYWGHPIETLDGLSIEIVDVIGGDSPQLDRFIAIPPGNRCRGCLVLVLEIGNSRGNTQEYVAQEDFELVRGNPKAPNRQTAEQITCADSDAIRSSRESTHLKPIPRGSNVFTRTLCFRNITTAQEDAEQDNIVVQANTVQEAEEEFVFVVRREFQLVYRTVYLAPTPSPGDTRNGSDRPEEQQAFRLGWIVLFDLY